LISDVEVEDIKTVKNHVTNSNSCIVHLDSLGSGVGMTRLNVYLERKGGYLLLGLQPPNLKLHKKFL